MHGTEDPDPGEGTGPVDDTAEPDVAAEETLGELARSFFYGSRSNLDFKFLARLPGPQVGAFVADVLGALSRTVDDHDGRPVADVVRRWQAVAYQPDPEEARRFAYDEGPFTPTSKPLSESRVALISSSGHFVEGHDPRPFGVDDMTQAQAEARVAEFLREVPTLSAIPIDTPPALLRVRHPGYPTAAAQADHQVALPMGHLADLAAADVIGEAAPVAYSFVGAASQLRLRDRVAPEWAERLHDEDIDVVLLVPV